MLHTRVVEIVRRQPVAAAFVTALMALVTIQGVLEVIDGKSTRTQRWWPAVALAVLVAYAIATFAYFASASARARIARTGKPAKRDSLSQVLWSMAVCPSITSTGAVLLGAPTWTLWATFAVTCALLAIWATQMHAGKI